LYLRGLFLRGRRGKGIRWGGRGKGIRWGGREGRTEEGAHEKCEA